MNKKDKNHENIDKDEREYRTQDIKDFMVKLKQIDNTVNEDLKKEDNKKENKTNKKETHINTTVNNNSSASKFYIGFNARLYFNVFLLVISMLALIYSVVMSFAITKKELIKYSIKSDIDYKIYLKPNDFYDEPYLGKDMVYVASLIDKVKIDYLYKFNVNKKSNIDFKYKVVGKLVIASQANNNIFFEKEYDLSKETTREMISNNSEVINETVSVDYGYYNTLANKFRSSYAVNTNSYLEVYLVVDEVSRKENTYLLKNQSKALVSIPLSQQEINVTLNNQNIDEDKQLVSDSKFIVKNSGYVFISVLLFLFAFLSVIEIIKKLLVLANKRNPYDIYINRILRGYDRIIVNIKTAPNFEKYNVIKVESFEELIDVRDNYKAPINYYVITEHIKSEFFVINNEDLYLYVVKAIDLDKGN